MKSDHRMVAVFGVSHAIAWDAGCRLDWEAIEVLLARPVRKILGLSGDAPVVIDELIITETAFGWRVMAVLP